MTWWQWTLTICGGIAALGGAIGYIVKAVKPIVKTNKRIELLEASNIATNVRFCAVEDAQQRQNDLQRESTQAMLKALTAMMQHMIDGNDIKGLKTARDELTTFIINR